MKLSEGMEASVLQENNNAVTIAIPRHIFRAYDIRGLVKNALTPVVVKAIGGAIATEMIHQGEHHIVVARDGRLSSQSLSEELITGLQAAGCHVLDIGLVPTPLLYFATQVLPITFGVMVTASHNPGDYNGLKIVWQGKTLSEEKLQRLYEIACKGEFTQGEGSYERQTLVEEYIAAIVDNVQLAKPLKVVVDCGNGAAGEVTPRVLRRLGCEVVPLYCEIDGRFPHHHPDPGHINNLQDLIERVQQEKAHVGIALDGDGDRLGVVTDEGTIIWPDRQMMLYAEDVLAKHHGATVLFDVKCSEHLPIIIKKAGGKPLMWKTGHSFIKQKMIETGALLAGEMSGHIFFKEGWFGFDDAIYSAARLLAILSRETVSCEVVFRRFPDSVNTPEINIPMADDKKKKFVDAVIAAGDYFQGEIITMDGIRVNFSDGWGLLRCSNTTPCLVLRFEAKNKQALARIQQQFSAVMLQIEPDLVLPF